jgi:hypothetical protein
MQSSHDILTETSSPARGTSEARRPHIGDTTLVFTTVELELGSACAPLPVSIKPEN